MTEEEKAAADKARQDAAGNIDKILAHLDSKFDSVNKRMDAFEEEKKADRRKADAARRDAERAEWMKADAAACERDDADEKTEKEELVAKGEPEETAADKARASRRDRMKARSDAAESEEAKRTREDSARRDVEDKARQDADVRDTKTRADAVLADQARMATTIANMPKSPTDADYGAMADAQAIYDSVYQAFGQRAPVPLQGEAVVGYRRRLARGIQTHSEKWKSIDLHTLPDAALGIAEEHIRADAAVAARTAGDVPDGTLMPVTRVNESGHRVTEFRGRETIFKRMAQPPMRATQWHTERRA